MYIKIYFGDKPLFLCDEINEEIEPYIHHDDTMFMDELDKHAVKTMIFEMQQSNIHAGVFKHHSLEELQKVFFKKFHLVKAAGGLVKHEAHEVLMIYRKGKWDLPKGKLDNGETLEKCAVREVEEETGLTGVILLSPIMITYHTYHEGTKFILKESHWYSMKSKKDMHFTPQQEEGITEIKWFDKSSLNKILSKTYPMIKDVITAL